MKITLAPGVVLELVLIPSGAFWMGDEIGSYKEKPKQQLTLPDYWMGKYPVTVPQYAAFIAASGYAIPLRPVNDLAHKPAFPVVQITWYDAQAFCRWVNTAILTEIDDRMALQARLPGEAEWEKAARGTDGRDYPWGSQPPDAALCNCCRDFGNISVMGNYSPQGDSPYGCADMSGNVREWTHSLDKPYPYLVDDGRESETESGERVVRGGDYYSMANFTRCAYRASKDPAQPSISRGFRLCISPIHFPSSGA